MSSQAMIKLVSGMLVAGGPTAQPARVRWPLHVALREMHDAAGRYGHRSLLDVPMTFRSSPDGGLAAEGADDAISLLVQQRVLRPAGAGRAAALVLDDQAAVSIRRSLMTIDPIAVSLIQRAGLRWAALVSTAWKNRSIEPESVVSIVTSSTPKRANLALLEGA